MPFHVRWSLFEPCTRITGVPCPCSTYVTLVVTRPIVLMMPSLPDVLGHRTTRPKLTRRRRPVLCRNAEIFCRAIVSQPLRGDHSCHGRPLAGARCSAHDRLDLLPRGVHRALCLFCAQRRSSSAPLGTGHRAARQLSRRDGG